MRLTVYFKADMAEKMAIKDFINGVGVIARSFMTSFNSVPVVFFEGVFNNCSHNQLLILIVITHSYFQWVLDISQILAIIDPI
tara:strand:- start:732 stop:980 length:249 start_codon:yes stop_codon:yes gene_type:complete